MKQYIVLPMILALLLGAAHAEYYTANEDIYYHSLAACTDHSDFSISEEAAWHFRKVACPVCVNRTASMGEITEIHVPQDFNLYSADMDVQGNIMLAGYAGTPMERYAYIALSTPDGQLLWQQQNSKEGLFYRDADILSDGSIAVLRPRSRDIGDDAWKIQIAKDGSITHQLPEISSAFRVEPAGDGFLVGSHPDTASYLLEKYDHSGNLIWQAREPGHIYLTLLSEAGMHLGYGRRAVDTADYQGAQDAFALILDDDGSIMARIVDESAREFTCGAWCADGGVLLSGLSDSAGFIAKYSAAGEEIWRRQLQYIRGEDGEIQIEGKAVRILAIQDILSTEGGHLLCMYTDDDYARMIEVDAEGYITRDWIEFIGDFASVDTMQMFKQDEMICLLTGGLTMDALEAYEAGMNLAEIPRKYTFKRIAAANG